MADDITQRLLNPSLYSRLCRLAKGKDRVKILRPGQPIEWHLVWQKVAGERKRARRVTSSGEEYAINCPYCGDHRQRLLVNHRFGVEDPELGGDNVWLAQCLNETRCLDDSDTQRRFFRELLGTFGRTLTLVERPRERLEELVGDPEPPGKVVSLAALEKAKPDHAAVTYLRGRNYDPTALSKLYGVGFCYECRDRSANNRIYIPIYEDGELKGWQARYIGDDVDGVPFSRARVPKYYTMPGYRKTAHLYNFRHAIECPTVVLVEGAIDVWGFGRQSVATFGCKLSYTQAELIARSWLQRHKAKTRVVLLYDPAAAVQARPGKPVKHQIEVAYARLCEHMEPAKILPVYLPQGDPGSLDAQLQREIVQRTAKHAGMRGLKLLEPDPVRLA